VDSKARAETVTGMSAGVTSEPLPPAPRPLVDEPPAVDDQAPGLHFDGQTVKYELMPADDGHWMLRMYDDSGAVAWIHLPRGQAHDTAWHLAYRMELRSYELPRYSA
jgi:hypothetical protein